MRRLDFDLSDVALDKLDDVLDVAVEVIDENSPQPGATRIERMARWLAGNVGGPEIARVLVADGLVSFPGGASVKPDVALGIAVAIIRAVERCR